MREHNKKQVKDVTAFTLSHTYTRLRTGDAGSGMGKNLRPGDMIFKR